MNKPNISYSQCGEDIIMLFLAKHILHLDNIYYLDLGCNEESLFNNTKLFYEEGYRGVSVDANGYFKKEYQRNRPGDVFVHAGVGTENSKAIFYEIDPHTLSTFSKDTALSYTANGVHKLVSKKKTPILTVDRILKKYCKTTPNLLSLDVEGMDLQILNSIDFNSWQPPIICAETLYYTTDSSEKKNDEVINYLSSKNYVIYADTYINTIFVSKYAMESREE